MAQSKFKKRLSAMKESWKESKTQYEYLFGDSKVETGNYFVRLQKSELTETKSSKKLVIKRVFIITKGRLQGVPIYDMIHIETPNGPTYLRKWINDMGFESPPDDNPELIEEIVDAISEEGAELEVYVKRDGDFTNVSILSLLEDDDPENSEEEEEEEEEEKEEEEEEEEKPVRRKRKQKKMTCPAGLKFGKDADKYDDCTDCPEDVWEKCMELTSK